MSETLPLAPAEPRLDLAGAHQWLAQVLVNFAKAEQAIGRLCVSLDLPIKNGPLGSVNELRERLKASDDRRCHMLEKRIARWQMLRPVRHVLAHATLQILFDEKRNPILVTRHLPLDRNDVTPDRVWTEAERAELLRLATNDGRSIHDQIRNLQTDAKLLAALRLP
ncbi:hypothetical protein [Sphingomonas sp.]